ncbi:ABC transporter ATP-binding protein [Actinomadura darangshiensis]|uniref:ABC transporter ATP-binding protein n=1 Tax=Actinomadura darangshiensis TaxID=705336 RepID=A0A4V2YVX4_9ACTN|nr:ABC transporter ATP-binding protein [Actinomadura darangshiensis]TDD83237.1 ABC transporter ATP-binding protein [Actinomadura darangshiensis]
MTEPEATPPTAGTATDESPVLRTEGLERRFGGLLAVSGVDLALPPGRTLGVIGPNGAGKSTLVNLISGHLKPTAGTVHVGGKDLTGARPWRVAHAGVARTFQIVKPFRGLTVADNVAVAAMFGPSPVRTPAHARREAAQVLERVGLGGRGDVPPAELSVADARRLELAKALALRPRVLLLDEVLAGLRPAEIDPALRLIDELRRDGLAVLIIEHIIQAIAAISDEVLVLHHGTVLTQGPPRQVLSDERVVEAYLGHRYTRKNRS